MGPHLKCLHPPQLYLLLKRSCGCKWGSISNEIWDCQPRQCSGNLNLHQTHWLLPPNQAPVPQIQKQFLNTMAYAAVYLPQCWLSTLHSLNLYKSLGNRNTHTHTPQPQFKAQINFLQHTVAQAASRAIVCSHTSIASPWGVPASPYHMGRNTYHKFSLVPEKSYTDMDLR